MTDYDEDMQDMEEDAELRDSIVIESSTNGGVEIEIGDGEAENSGVIKPNFPQVSAKDLNVSLAPLSLGAPLWTSLDSGFCSLNPCWCHSLWVPRVGRSVSHPIAKPRWRKTGWKSTLQLLNIWNSRSGWTFSRERSRFGYWGSLLANPVFVPVVVVDFGFHSFIFYRPPSSLRMEAPCRRLLTLFVPLCLVLMWMWVFLKPFWFSVPRS